MPKGQGALLQYLQELETQHDCYSILNKKKVKQEVGHNPKNAWKARNDNQTIRYVQNQKQASTSML